MTIHDLPQKSIQEIFEHIATHLVKQNHRAFNGAICAYRGKNNYSCAIGCLIPDEEYKPTMEGGGVSELMCKYFPQINTQIDRDKQNVLIRMQTIHDYFSPAEWLSQIFQYAKYKNLNTEFMNNLVG